MCIEPIQHCNTEVNSASDEKLITELNDKITELQNKIARVLQLIQPLTIFKSTKGLDQIEAILEEITSIINQK
jgi:flagellin-specific chaperone FliS